MSWKIPVFVIALPAVLLAGFLVVCEIVAPGRQRPVWGVPKAPGTSDSLEGLYSDGSQGLRINADGSCVYTCCGRCGNAPAISVPGAWQLNGTRLTLSPADQMADLALLDIYQLSNRWIFVPATREASARYTREGYTASSCLHPWEWFGLQ